MASKAQNTAPLTTDLSLPPPLPLLALRVILCGQSRLALNAHPPPAPSITRVLRLQAHAAMPRLSRDLCHLSAAQSTSRLI